MLTKLLDILPAWLHPRYPLVAKETRHLRSVDYRILQLGNLLHAALKGSTILIGILLMVFVVAGQQLAGFILYPFTIVISGSVVIVGELLFLRVLASIPPQVGDFIAGERERRTWDTLLSTPIPRYQIIVAKFSAIFWNNIHALWPLMLGRSIMIALLFVEHIALTTGEVPIQLGDAALMLVVGLIVCVAPLAELGSVAGIGLLASMRTTNRIHVSLLVWLYWTLYRAGAALAMGSGVTFSTQQVSEQLGLIVVPHWTLYYIWIDTPYRDQAHLLQMGGGFYLILPLILCIMCLVLTIRFVQYQDILLSQTN